MFKALFVWLSVAGLRVEPGLVDVLLELLSDLGLVHVHARDIPLIAYHQHVMITGIGDPEGEEEQWGAMSVAEC